LRNEEIKSLFASLKEKTEVLDVDLHVLRVRNKKFILDGFTDPRFKRVILTINEDFEELPSEIFSVVMLHELKHLKYPKFSEKIIHAETVKQYEKIFNKSFPEFETEIR